MQYLDTFTPASDDAEVTFLLNTRKLDMTCYDMSNAYPFKVLSERGLGTIEFAPLTVFYGGNGSGKSTLLNIIAEKLGVCRMAPFNHTHLYEDYLRLCKYEMTFGKQIPENSSIITSDDVFEFLLDVRSINQGVDRNRELLFDEYASYHKTSYRMTSLEDYDELKRRNKARHMTRSAYTAAHLPGNLVTSSNGESAYTYFTDKIRDHALYLLDEPENSLSAHLQAAIAQFLEDSVRFYDCQIIICTHSPFLLSMKGARIYDLDTKPVAIKKWTELENVRAYQLFFEKHRGEFQ